MPSIPPRRFGSGNEKSPRRTLIALVCSEPSSPKHLLASPNTVSITGNPFPLFHSPRPLAKPNHFLTPTSSVGGRIGGGSAARWDTRIQGYHARQSSIKSVFSRQSCVRNVGDGDENNFLSAHPWLGPTASSRHSLLSRHGSTRLHLRV